MKDMPIADSRDFLIREVLNNDGYSHNTDIQKKLSYLGRERISKPLIYVGMGTCGVISGATIVYQNIKEYLEGYNYDAYLVEGGCNGFCSMEPIVDIQLPGRSRVVFGKVTEESVPALLEEMLNYSIPQGATIIGQYESDIFQNWEGVSFLSRHPFYALQQRNLLAHCGIIDPVSATEYIARGGYVAFSKTIAKQTPADACRTIAESQLTGRGGGSFPVGEKWAKVQTAIAGQKYFIANAVESDPGSYMNRMVMESNPHLLIESLLIGAYATGSSKAFLFTRKEFQKATIRFEAALEQAREFGLVGHNILDSGVNIELFVKKGPRAFVCGEETALIHCIEGKRAMPEAKPPYPVEKGLWDKPTCVNNVETLINVPFILQNGAESYKSIGTQSTKGTKVLTLSGRTQYRGIIEVPMGITFRSIVEGIGGGIRDNKRFKAVILGINSGNIITENTLDYKMDIEQLRNIGISPGSGGFAVADEGVCMVDMAAHFTAFFHKESCGKCIPCREGTAIISHILQQATRKPDGLRKTTALERFKGIMQIKSVASVMKDTSLCALGRSAPNAIMAVMQNFNEELKSHIYDRKCAAGVCRGLRMFHIDPDKCIGCTVCFKKCPEEAIIGAMKHPHFIIEDRCSGCGICYESCKFNAISIQ